MRVRSVLLVTAGIVGAGVGGAAIASALTDPISNVEPVVLTELGSARPVHEPGTGESTVTDPTGTTPTTFGLSVQSVDGLESLVGTLRSGEDPDDWYVSGVEVDFGPDAWILGAPAVADYDGDGTVEPLLDELRGLEGRSVTLGVRYELDDDRDDADAFRIEELAYRDPNGGLAPWQTVPVGIEATRDDIAAAAAAAVGQGAVTTDVEGETEDGWNGWDVDVRAADGREYQVYVDLAGNVIDVRPDTD